MTRYATILVLGTLAVAFVGCQPEPEEPPMEQEQPAASAVPDHPPATETGATAAAQLQPGDSGAGISGTVRFTQESGGVRVQADLSGLSPGKHGFHVHENGQCTPPFESAGDHLNPYNLEHGCPPAELRHLGDLGNVEAGEDGTATFDQVIDKISLVDPGHQVAGKAVILHQGEDDCTTQPAGDSGARIACGVIEMTSHAAGGEAPATDHRPPGE